MTPLEFLNGLWQYKPEDQYILIWTAPDRRSRWFTSVSAAAEYVAGINGGRDVYVGVGLAGKDYGPSHRCVSNEITGIAGMSADFDIASEAHAAKPLPRTIEEAISLAPGHMPPSLTIATGNGVHCWWLLREPHVFESEQDRQEVARLALRWHTMLKLAAASRGWVYERLADLARILRIPDTRNLKDPANPKDVQLYADTGKRYNLCDFEEFLDAAGIPDQEAQDRAARQWAERFADKKLVINQGARIPQEYLDLWMSLDMRFKNTWLRQRHDLKDQSNSGYDMALAWFGVTSKLPEQLIVDLIIHHRAVHGQKQRTRLDYYQRTIAAAASRSEAASATAPPAVLEHTAQIAPPAESPQDPPPSPPVDPQFAKAILCQEIGQCLGINLLKMVKFEGKDPTYHIHTDKGIIEVPSIDKLICFASVRSKIAAKIGKLIHHIKPKEWEAIAQKLLDACDVEDCTEEEDFEGSSWWNLYYYLQESKFIAAIEGQRVQDQRLPMVVNGRIVVSSGDFAAYLSKTKGGLFTAKSAASMLGAIGATRSEKFRSSKKYRQIRWVLPLPDFDPANIKPNAPEKESIQ